MPRLQRTTRRGDTTSIISNYRWCPIEKFRVYKGICDKECEEPKCPISAAKMDARREKKLKAAARRRKKKIEAEQKKLDDLGFTRNLLLKPEDIVKEEPKEKDKKDKKKRKK